MNFVRHIGIDYSGRGEPTTGTPAIQVYEKSNQEDPVPVRPLKARSWSRESVALWLAEQCRAEDRLIVGIDHAFSFPMSYMRRHRLTRWDDFLNHFIERWPTHRQSVESLRALNRAHGDSKELRLTDQWTSSAKSVFLFDVNGSVAKSTHAGLPWLIHLRDEHADRLFFWPFDGWDIPPDKHVIAEVYPSLFRNRYRRPNLKGDALDAYAVAKWLGEMDSRGTLAQYFSPPLSNDEKNLARLEGWILGLY